MASIPPPSLFDGTRVPGIYGIYHVATGRVYVGSTVDIKKRWRDHLTDLTTATHGNRYLQRSWDKYGAAAFVFRVLEVVPQVTNLLQAEQRWIDALSASNRQTGFNICPTAGSPLGRKLTPEQLARHSASRKGKPLPGAKGLVRNATLREVDVITILKRLAEGAQHKALAAEYSTSRHTISAIANRRAWNHLKVSEEQVACIKSFQYRTTKGSARGSAKLNEAQVLEIRNLATEGMMLKDIAAIYKVSPCTVSLIVKRKKWSWLE